jgi:transposase
MPQPNDLSRSLAALDQDSTLIAVIEMSQSTWLVAGIVPGINRQPLKKLAADEATLLQLLYRWRDEATKAGRTIDRIAVAYEAGRDGFWLARWLRGRGIEAYVIHPTSVAVSREHRRAKTDRLDTELLKRAFLGWLRGEARHCSMAKIPTPEEEDAKRPNRERENLVSERTRIVNRMKSTLARLGLRGFKPTLRGPAPAKAGGGRTSRQAAHRGRCAAAAEHAGRAAPGYGASALCHGPDPGDRGGAPDQARAAPGTGQPRDGPAAGAGHRRRHRDSRHARSRDPVAQLA